VIVIVAGVAGSGKSTVGTMLASELGWPFADGDAFHSAAALAKMRSGVPLTDEDRAPWLLGCKEWMNETMDAGESGVLACSALKRRYRETLLLGCPSATIVFLEVSREVLAHRLHNRASHFFPVKLMKSQLDLVEPPEPGERVQTVNAEGDPAQTVSKIIALLWPDGCPT